jgi:Tol biopolymer transport system component
LARVLNQSFSSIYSMTADGTGAPERLTVAAGDNQFVNAPSPDGRSVVMYVASSKTGQDLLVAPLDGTKTIRPLIQTSFNETAATLSPDGRWLAYQSNESGQNEVYVRPYPNVDPGRWQVSTEGGITPAWSRDGRELFYVAGDARLMAVATTQSPGLARRPISLMCASSRRRGGASCDRRRFRPSPRTRPRP